jgi:hypothetical protein
MQFVLSINVRRVFFKILSQYRVTNRAKIMSVLYCAADQFTEFDEWQLKPCLKNYGFDSSPLTASWNIIGRPTSRDVHPGTYFSRVTIFCLSQLQFLTFFLAKTSTCNKATRSCRRSYARRCYLAFSAILTFLHFLIH